MRDVTADGLARQVRKSADAALSSQQAARAEAARIERERQAERDRLERERQDQQR